MKILVIDNYDSFTYNLVQLIGEFTEDIEVYRNDRISTDQAAELKPDKIVISPGPGFPSDAGISSDIVRELGKNIPVLGVCLGHQVIGEVYGGKIVHAPGIMHGKASELVHDGKKIYHGLPEKINAGRYHSLVINEESLPKELEITARTDGDIIMGVRHNNFPVEGIQFHPESVLTETGYLLIKNWIEL